MDALYTLIEPFFSVYAEKKNLCPFKIFKWVKNRIRRTNFKKTLYYIQNGYALYTLIEPFFSVYAEKKNLYSFKIFNRLFEDL